MGRIDPRYDSRDFASPRAIRAANYDRLRSEGVPVENAARIANKSVDKTLAKIDSGTGFAPSKPKGPAAFGSSGRSRFRTPFDFEKTE